MTVPFYPGTPPTRILNWNQLVREADPNYQRLSLQPWVLEFSNGRLFVDWNPLYGTYDIVDDLLLVRYGNPPLQLVGGGQLLLIAQQ